jgi:peptide/nickel transport system substrate-binding protein
MKWAAMVMAALLVSGCAAGGTAAQNLQNSAQLADKTLDINPRDPATLHDGNFVWPLTTWQPNWNYNQVDGTDDDEKSVLNAILPRLVLIQPDGTAKMNPDYVTAARVTSTAPQVVTYDLNPKARWTDGTPLDWQDFRAQWAAMNGSDPKFEAATTTGYSDIASVARGADDHQVVVTFSKPFAEWQSLFTLLYPRAVNADADTFNTSLTAGPPSISAGPFKVQRVDKGANTIVLARDDGWWGPKAVLSKITFQVVSIANWADALANGEITYAPLAANADLYRRAQSMPNIAIRTTVAANYNNVQFDARPGKVLSDPKVRSAVAKAIDPGAIERAVIGTIEPNPVPIGNHLYLPGTKYHQDHSAGLTFDLARAQRELDAAGWTRAAGAQYRRKDGKELDLSLLGSDNSSDTVVDAMIRLLVSQLAAAGVKVTVDPISDSEYTTTVDKGDWDIVTGGWFVSPFAISATAPQYLLTPNSTGQNWGQIGDPAINSLYERANATLDDTARAALGNEIDAALWREAVDVPTYQSPGVRLVARNVANFGAFGFSDVDYPRIGFTA